MNYYALLCPDTGYIDDVKKILHEEGFNKSELAKREDILNEITKGYIDIVFVDCSCKLCERNLIPTIKNIKKLDPRVNIICVGVENNGAKSVEVIKNGASACLVAPFDTDLIRTTISNIKELSSTRREILEIETELHKKYIFHKMVSKNPVMLDIFSLVHRVAPYYRTMLITGDTGTGKEALARAVHELSVGKNKPFVTCNCSGLVEHLIESELFGHVKGAFTGAIADKKGLFEAAGDGTIFLDEIGHMPLSFQPHLLRVLQDGEFRPVGSTVTKKASCRVIAAANVDIKEKIKEGLFRDDLYYRLSSVTLVLPPLRTRKEDLPLLFRFILQKFQEQTGKDVVGISMPTRRILMSYNWPGNIRELENVIERAALVATAKFISPKDLPDYLGEIKTETDGSFSIDEIVKAHIERVMMSVGGNKSRAASLLGINRRSLQRKIGKLGLH